MRRRIPCVGAVIRDERGRLLLVRRGRPPGEGLWSIPGGRVEQGESDAVAVVREVAEETGLRVSAGAVVGEVERDAPDGNVYLIRDLACEVLGGTLRHGDDACAAGWFTPDQVRGLPTAPGLVQALTDWRAL
jgi:ADP-ribose pyrophosphatase YjhB (NUDIX family)